MKKVFTFLVAMATMTTGAFSFAQANATGNIIIDPYYGFPNVGSSLSKSFQQDNNTSGLKVNGIGPLGFRAEYMVADNVGVGLDVIYNSYSFNYNYATQDSVYDGNTNTWSSQTVETDREFKMQRLRVQARFNFHFNVNNPDLDAYFGVGAGTNNRFRSLTENGKKITDDVSLNNFTLFPFSLRVCTGMRYYFTENIGVNAEIGLGGPLISAGLSLRL